MSRRLKSSLGLIVVALLTLAPDVRAAVAQVRLRAAPAAEGACDAAHLSNCRLLTESDFTFDGGFCPSTVSSNGYYANNSPSHGIAYRESTNTMFITLGDGSKPRIGELTIPTLAMTVGAMSEGTWTATGPITDPSEDDYASSFTDGITTSQFSNSSALHVWGGTQLLFAGEYFYDAAPNQFKTFALRPLDLTDTGHVAGPETFTGVNDGVGVDTTRMQTMFVGEMPSEWVTALGGYAAYAGAGLSYSSVANQSWGPGFFGINPSVIGTGSAKNIQPYVFYPDGHRTLGIWGDNPPTSPYFNFGTQMRGGGIIGGSRTAIIVGIQGTDNFCYGPGLADPDDPLIGTPYPDPVTGPYQYCYDPTEPNEANHGYPYVPVAIAYDLLDFKAVIDGTKHAWEVLPYAQWTIDFPVVLDPATVRSFAAGMSVDNVNHKVWIGQSSSFGAGCAGNNGIIWRMSVNLTPTP